MKGQGKHSIHGKYTKNNYSVNNKKVKNKFLFIFTSAVILSSLSGTIVSIKNNNSSDYSVSQIIDINNFESEFEKLYDYYEVDTSEKDMLSSSLNYPISNYKSSAMLMTEYIYNILSSNSLSVDERNSIISSFLYHSGQIRNDSIEYVKNIISSITSNSVIVDNQDVDTDKLQSVIDNAELMNCISECSFKYRIPKSLLIALAVCNYGNSSRNIMGISDGWINITSSHMVYDYSDIEPVKKDMLSFITDNKSNLSDMKVNVEYAAMIISECLNKINDNYNIFDAIKDYFPNVYSAKKSTVEVINYMFKYEKDMQITFDYYSYDNSSCHVKTVQLISLKYDEYLENLYNNITSDIYFELVDDNTKYDGKIRKLIM